MRILLFEANRPLSRGGNFISGDLKSFVYAWLALCRAQTKLFKSPKTKWPPRNKGLFCAEVITSVFTLKCKMPL